MKSKNALNILTAGFGILITIVSVAAAFAQPMGTRYIGCFKDTYDRDLKGYTQQDARMTLQLCADICRQKGFRYAAAQYGAQCFCGNSYGRHGKAANCDMMCAGNSNEVCGGSWANSLYELGAFGVTGGGDRDSTTTGNYQGCFKDTENRDVSGYNYYSDQMTLQSCANRCREKGYKYAASQYGSQCFCGDSFGKYGEATNCNMKCAGNGNEVCGGFWANSVYSVTAGITTSTGAAPGLTGFWKDNKGAIYSVRQVGNQIWWYMDGKPNWTNVFKGDKSGSTITGEWCDVPGGRIEGNQTGSLTVKKINNDRMEKVSASPAYGGSVWTRISTDANR